MSSENPSKLTSPTASACIYPSFEHRNIRLSSIQFLLMVVDKGTRVAGLHNVFYVEKKLQLLALLGSLNQR